MANDMRLEFEEYVRELTESISKEIFLEDLKGICDKYSKQLMQYEQLVRVAEGAADRMEAFSAEEEADIKALSQNVNQELDLLHNTVNGLHDEYGKIFDGFSNQVNLLNQSERNAFVYTLDQKISEYESALVRSLQKEYEELFQRLTKEFEEVCRKNDIQYKDFELLVKDAKATYDALVSRQDTALLQMKNVDRTVGEKLKAIEDRISAINKRHVEVFGQFSEKVTALNAKERESFCTELQNVLNRYRGSFAEELATKYDAISDKFRGDLAGIYQKYEAQLQAYQVILQDVQKNNQEMQRFTAQNLPALEKLSAGVEENLTQINQTLSEVTGDYARVFAGFSERVTALNTEERQKFLVEMRKTFMADIMVMHQSYEQSQAQWKEMADQIAQLMNSTAVEQKQYYQQDRKTFLQHLGQQLKDFKDNMNEEILGLQKFTEQIVAERKEIQNLSGELQNVMDRVARDEEDFLVMIRRNERQMHQLMENMQETQKKMASDHYALWEKMVAEWNKQKDSLDKQREHTAWKVYMTITNSLMVILFTVLVILQKPWEVFGKQEGLVMLAVFGVLILLLLFRKLIVSLFIKDRNIIEDK